MGAKLGVLALQLAALSFVGALSACTDAGIQYQPPEDLLEFDNLLDVRGEFCTQPDATVEFPVKVLFLFDQSASLQFTDGSNRRAEALRDALGGLFASPATSVGAIGFASWAREIPFGSNRDAFSELATINSGVATDYQGALAGAIKLLEQDMITVGPAERARTRYVVVFVSDGVPEPACKAGCEDGDETCSDGGDNDGDGLVDGADPDCADVLPAQLGGEAFICNLSEEEVRMAVEDDEYTAFSGLCPAYNQPEQILQRVNDLMALRDIYSVGAISLNTVFLFTTEEIPLMLDREAANALLRAMARDGEGTFRDVNLASNENDSFLDFDFRALQAPQWLAGLSATNTYSVSEQEGVFVDTDQDGLSDQQEIELGTDPRNPDSDLQGGDGYSDMFESRLRDDGFDPTDSNAPAIPCTDTDDLDGDGLRNCEEAYLGLDPRHQDTDGDEIIDWFEVVYGTDPTKADRLDDLDFDTIANGEEIQAGTDPARPDLERYRAEGVAYSVDDLGRKSVRSFSSGNEEERQCYAFSIDNMQLVTPPVVPDRGINRVMIYAHEEPAGLAGARAVVQVACFEAFYDEGNKFPESGLIDASAEGWLARLTQFQTAVDSLLACPWFDAGSFNRGSIVGAIDQCLPEDIVIGRYQYGEMDLINLLQSYVAQNTGLNLPQPASELFVPIEQFDESRDCYRPWELDRLEALFAQILDACALCDDPNPPEDAVISECCS